MSYTYNQKSKRRRRAEDEDLKNTRNLIRKGKVPRFTVLKDKKGLIPKRGRFNFKDPEWEKMSDAEKEKNRMGGYRPKGKRAFVARFGNFLRYSVGLIEKAGRK